MKEFHLFYISFDCHCYYLLFVICYYYSATLIVQIGNAQKRKMHVQLETLHLQDFLSHKSFAQCSLKRKIRTHFHHYTTCDNRKESKRHFYATKRCWLTTRKPFFTKIFTNPSFLPANVAVHDKTY